MIDPEIESLIPLSSVPTLKCLPLRRGGKKLALSTLWRWSTSGLRGRRLETVKVGGQRCTTLAALKRFIALESPRDPSCASTTHPAPSAQKRKEVEKKLDELGI